MDGRTDGRTWLGARDTCVSKKNKIWLIFQPFLLLFSPKSSPNLLSILFPTFIFIISCIFWQTNFQLVVRICLTFFYICLRILFTAMILCNLFSELFFILKRKSNIYMLEVLGPGGLPDFGSLDFVLRKLQAIQGVRFLMICLHFSRFKSAFFNLTWCIFQVLSFVFL